MATTAGVIWLFVCVRYWPYRGVGSMVCAYFGLIKPTPSFTPVSDLKTVHDTVPKIAQSNLLIFCNI